MRETLWRWLGAPAMALTFHNWYGVRRRILRVFGATLADTARVRPSARISAPWRLVMGRESSIGDRAVIECDAGVRIGDFVTVSQLAYVCTAGVRTDDPRLPIERRAVEIGDDAWIGADAFVGPGVRVGPGAILGAKASAFEDLAPWTVYGGEPLRVLRGRERPAEG